jgi:hypothetical protein
MRTFVLMYCITLLSAVTGLKAQSRKDTVFLVKNYTSEGNRHIVYIENDPKAWPYNKVLEKNIDQETYRMYLQQAKDKYNVAPAKHRIPAVSKNWYPLHLYKGKYYVYYPSDNCDNNRMSINDSCVVLTAGCEGPYPAVLQNISMEQNGDVNINMVDPLEGKVRMKIHIINPQRGIAVVERRGADGRSRFQLMVDEKSLKTFRLLLTTTHWKKVPSLILRKLISNDYPDDKGCRYD